MARKYFNRFVTGMTTLASINNLLCIGKELTDDLCTWWHPKSKSRRTERIAYQSSNEQHLSRRKNFPATLAVKSENEQFLRIIGVDLSIAKVVTSTKRGKPRKTCRMTINLPRKLINIPGFFACSLTNFAIYTVLIAINPDWNTNYFLRMRWSYDILASSSLLH